MPKNENVKIKKRNGKTVGPYLAKFAGSTILLLDENADIDEGDVIIRVLPNGKDQPHYVKEATYFSRGVGGIAAHFQIKFSTQAPSQGSETPSSQNITISRAHSVQIGNHNTQHVQSAVQLLTDAIENSTASSSQREEAKSLLATFLRHPLVVAIAGKVF